MNNTIYKCILQVADWQEINLPANAEILCVQNQNETICIWVQLDPNEQKMQQRAICIIGTGREIIHPSRLKYIDSIQMIKGDLVWHIYEEVK